jgi:hypothetical protein
LRGSKDRFGLGPIIDLLSRIRRVSVDRLLVARDLGHFLPSPDFIGISILS